MSLAKHAETKQDSLGPSVDEGRTKLQPEKGPALLFFSGGTALKKFTRTLTRFTHNSIHILTPFDSGGSSATLRSTFGMPAVGDVRSRLLALADQSLKGNKEAYALANYRFSVTEDKTKLAPELEELVRGKHKLIESIPSPLKQTIMLQLARFNSAMPQDFDLRGASIGNLILAGSFLLETHNLNDTIALFAELLGVQGEVRTICDVPYHLAVELKNGECLVGQHQFTGKQTKAIASPIQRIWLTKSITDTQPVEAELCRTTKDKIADAALICYPPGSFYSSLIANLLPVGVGRAIAESSRPKVYVPNLGEDPEQFGIDIETQVDILLHYLNQDHLHNKLSDNSEKNTCQSFSHNPYLNYVLLDSRMASGLRKGAIERWAELGIQTISDALICPADPQRYDDEKLCHALLALSQK
jgi:CofD-related protein of GAK system